MNEPLNFIRVKNFIDGEWVEERGMEYVPLYNPSTGAQIGEVPLSKPDTSLEAVQSAYIAYGSWSNFSVSKRLSYLYKMRQAMIDKEEELAFAIAVDQAKHISEARGEVQRVVQIIETACSIPTLIQAETLDNIADNICGRVIKSPLGVFCGVAPFNFPALVFGWFIPFAIGVGNTFVFKPSTQSPYFMQKMADIFVEIGLPKGVINIVHGNRNMVQPWYSDSRVSGICLVGSTPTAKQMAEACGRGGKRSMLLGGAKNFLVVMEDVQWDVFIENYLHSCYGSAGQRCLAGSILAAVPEIYDELIERVVSASKKVKIGDAMDPDVYMGPVISAEARQKVERYIDIGIKEGAELILDGRNPAVPDEIKNGYYVGPTIFTNVTPEMTIYKEEIFGPVVSVIKVNCINTALDLIRKQEFGNGACIFTQNLFYTEKFINQADVGMVGVNVGICAPHPYLPFGGIKNSHLGTNKVQGRDGINFFTQNKIATIRFSPPTGKFQDSGSAVSKETNTLEKPAVRSCVAS
jgi:malonate-semialdehyde dehydrogenase (acetylating) / methylmalonate-semialdehyde dehydrogenase